MNTRTLIFACLLVLLPGRVAAGDNCTVASRQIEHFRGKDPAAEARGSIEKGTLEFLGVFGYSIDAPGVSDSQLACYSDIPIRGIEGTSDFVPCESVRTLNRIAEEYAERFNGVMLEEIKKRGMKCFKT